MIEFIAGYIIGKNADNPDTKHRESHKYEERRLNAGSIIIGMCILIGIFILNR